MMNEVPRQTLRKLIAKHGRDLCSDARRCEALLRDACGAYRREINILITALKERIPLDLLAAQSSIPRGLLLMRLAKRLEDQLALTEEAARWAVETWALALGLITDAELEAVKAKQAAASPPPPTADESARQGVEGEGRSKRPTATADSQTPTTKPQPPPPSPPSPPKQPPPRIRPTTSPRVANPSPAKPLTAAPSPAGGSTPARSQTPARPALPVSHAPEPPDYSFDPASTRRSVGWRGCLIGCFLLMLLSLLLFLVAPYVISLLREEQRRTNDAPPRVQPQ